MWLIIFLVWLALASWLSYKILSKIFPAGWVNGALAVFFPLFLLGPMANIFTAWFKLTEKSFLFCLIAIILILAAWAYWFSRQPGNNGLEPEQEEENRFPLWLWPVFHLLLVMAAFFIWASASAGSMISPWQVLPIWYLLLTGAAAAIIFYAIFKKENSIRILLGIILFSLLIHGYLLVYQNGFGGDRFRHLGSEERIMSGQEYQPTLQTDDIWWVKIGPISAPQALFDSSKLSYGTEWSLEVIASKISGWPVFQINRFLLPLLWSIFLPLLIYLGALLIKSARKFALLAAQSASCLYLWQYYGGQGLPASYGLLWLALIFVLILAYLKRGSRPLLGLIILSLALSYFNYSLGFISALIFFAMAWMIKNRPRLVYFSAIISIALLMLADYFSASIFSLSWRAPLLAIIGSNLVYFNPFSYNFGEWHLVIDLLFVAAIIVLIIWSLKSAIKPDSKSWQFVFWLFFIPMCAYLLSNSFFTGEHSLARRLTLFAVLPAVFIFARIIEHLAAKIKPELAAIALGAIFMLTYYSGPMLDVSISNDDLARARQLWPIIQADPQACVKESEPVILALEYVSAKNFQETINNQNCLDALKN